MGPDCLPPLRNSSLTLRLGSLLRFASNPLSFWPFVSNLIKDMRWILPCKTQSRLTPSLESTISGLTENRLGSRPRSRRPSPPRKSYSHTYAGRKSFHPSKCLSRSGFKRVRVGSPCTSPMIRSLGDFSFSNVPASNLIDFLIRFVLERGNEPPVGVHFCFVSITDSASIFALACKMIRGPADLGIISSNLSSRSNVSG